MNVMVLAGGPDQAALIQEIKILYPESRIILVDMNPNVVASKVADRHAVVSTMDFGAVKQVAKEENVDIILTACGDQPLLTMANVSEELGLPCFLSKQKVLTLTNKMYMKELMVNNGIPTSRYKTFAENQPIEDAGLKYPLIVKPVDSNGSKGVRKVANKEELIHYAKEARSYSITKTIIVEEFVEGEEVSSDFYITNNGVIPVLNCLSNKFKPNPETALIYQSIIPPPLSQTVKDKLLKIAERIAEVFEISNSPLLIQTLIKGEDVNVVEFSARLGGGAKYKTIKEVTGFNVLRANLLSMLGEVPDIELSTDTRKFSRCHLYCKPGILQEIKGLEKLQETGMIDDYVVIKEAGAKIEEPKSSGDRIGSILVSANSFAELEEKILNALNLLSVTDTAGKDILYREIFKNPVKNSDSI